MIEKIKQDKIWQIYAAGIVLYIVLMIFALAYMGQSSFNLTINYLTGNDLASHTATFFAQATSTLWVVQYRYFLTVFLGLSLVCPAVYIFWIKTGKKNIDFHRLRWIDFALSSAAIISTVAILSSLSDIMTIALVFGLIIISCSVFWIAAHQYGVNNSLYRKSAVLGILGIILPWLLIAFYTSSTWVYGGVRSPWYTYALSFIGVINTAMIIYGPIWHRNRKAKADLLSTEVYPIVAGQFIKVLFSIILIVGLH